MHERAKSENDRAGVRVIFALLDNTDDGDISAEELGAEIISESRGRRNSQRVFRIS